MPLALWAQARASPGRPDTRGKAGELSWRDTMWNFKLRKMLPALLTASGLAAAAPATAAAQAGVGLVPWAGAYIPTRNEISDIDNALSRDVSVMGGARLTF